MLMPCQLLLFINNKLLKQNKQRNNLRNYRIVKRVLTITTVLITKVHLTNIILYYT